jgi:hypothetical protein
VAHKCTGLLGPQLLRCYTGCRQSGARHHVHGLFFTLLGVEFLKSRLQVVVFQKFLDESSPIYKPALAQTVNKIHGTELKSNVATLGERARARVKAAAEAAGGHCRR